MPFYRILLSGGLVNPTARRFALMWGIQVIEPDRLPFILLHFLAGRMIESLKYVSLKTREEILDEIPRLIGPLQQRLHRIAGILEREEPLVGKHRLDCAIDNHQRINGDYYWNSLDELDAFWLEEQFDNLAKELRLDNLS